MLGNQILGENIFYFQKFVENPRYAIVNSRWFGPMKILIF